MYKIAVLGDRESVLGFKALGLEVCFAETADEARSTFLLLSREDEGVAVIYLTEQLAAGLSGEIAALGDRVTPAVILIPGKEGSLGIGMRGVHASVERAVGADILNNQ